MLTGIASRCRGKLVSGRPAVSSLCPRVVPHGTRGAITPCNGLLRRNFVDSPATPENHPRQWAIWRKMDKDRSGTVSREEIRTMCRRFDATGSAALLEEVLDPEGKGECSFQSFCDNFSAVATVRREARRRHWNRTFGLGVAGNVAGHMAQAGEADSGSAPTATPAAVFTFYAPHPHTVDASEEEILELLSQFPVTNATLELPHKIKAAGNIQVEPELGLYCDIVYSKEGDCVERLVPRRVAAFNDCSIRKLDSAQKLSEKKNWGFGSKGISLKSIRIDSMSTGSLVDKLVLVSYIKRGGQVHQYSVDAPARNYLLFHDALMDWIIDRINTQADCDKWLPIFPELVKSDYPTSMWIALGAGEYTEWGAKNFLESKDEVVVLVYNEDVYPNGPGMDIVNGIFEDREFPDDGLVYLHQTFI